MPKHVANLYVRNVNETHFCTCCGRWVLVIMSTRPQVADGEDGPKIWRETENIYIMRLWVGDKGWSSSLAVGTDANNYINMLRNITQVSDLDVEFSLRQR
jgi:hypothetical protein